AAGAKVDQDRFQSELSGPHLDTSVPSESASSPAAHEQEIINFTSQPRVVGDDLVDGSLLLQVASMDDAIAQGQRDRLAVTSPRAKVAGSPTIRFPRWEREILPVK